VFVVRRSAFFGGDWPQGFRTSGAEGGRALLAQLLDRGFFTERSAAEQDPSLKQLIPYCLLARGRELFCVQRLRRQSEGRLHGLYSVGLGGHVNPDDGNPVATAQPDLLERALRRELAEELHLSGASGVQPRFLGLLNDDASAVGRVHAGLAYLLTVSATADVRVREVGKMRGAFVDLDELRRVALGCPVRDGAARVVESSGMWQDAPAFESWSAIMLEAGSWAGFGCDNEG
jgi:predicted NUDIX family phosphoesterase